MTFQLGLVHQFASFLRDNHLLRIHLVLGKVLNLNLVEVAQSAMQGDVSLVDTVDFHTLHQLAGEVKTGSRSCNGTLYLSENTLEIFHIILCSVMILTGIYDIARKRSLTQSKERTLEDIVVAILIIEETEGTATAGSIVDNLGNHLVDIIEEKLVADTDFAGRLYQYVPKAHLRIELTEQEHLNLGIGLLLGAVKTGWKYLGIVEDEGIALFEEIHDILELQEYWIAIGINHILAFLIFLVHLDGF